MRDPGAAEPRPYQRVYAHLRGRIEQGELSHGAQLPSQPALAAEYGVALLTVRHAIELLRRAGPRFPSTIFIVVSAYPDDLVALYRSDAFPITVIPKPFRAEQVRRALALLRGSDGHGAAQQAAAAEAR